MGLTQLMARPALRRLSTQRSWLPNLVPGLHSHHLCSCSNLPKLNTSSKFAGAPCECALQLKCAIFSSSSLASSARYTISI